MKTIACALLVVLCVAAADARQQPAANLEPAVDAYVKPYLDAGGFSGAILVARGGKMLLSKGYGMANYELGVANTPKTKFHIASVSKSFTAAAVLLLEERGLLAVTDPLSKYI